jgi:hypothetical protein
VIFNKDCVDELKHSIMTHISIANGPTAGLAVISVKMVDVLECGDVDQANIDIATMACILIKELCEVAIIRLEQSGAPKGVVERVKLGPVVDFIGRPLDGKNHYLRMLSSIFAELCTYTGDEYPKICDSKGSEV